MNEFCLCLELSYVFVYVCDCYVRMCVIAIYKFVYIVEESMKLLI